MQSDGPKGPAYLAWPGAGRTIEVSPDDFEAMDIALGLVRGASIGSTGRDQACASGCRQRT